MKTLHMIRSEGWLIPADEEDLEVLRTLPQGVILGVKVSHGMNVEKHRLYFLMLRSLLDNWTADQAYQPPTTGTKTQIMESFHDAVKKVCGWVKEVWNIKEQKAELHVKSISFEDCSGEDFEIFFENFKCFAESILGCDISLTLTNKKPRGKT